jgi:hypothetical protein
MQGVMKHMLALVGDSMMFGAIDWIQCNADGMIRNPPPLRNIVLQASPTNGFFKREM